MSASRRKGTSWESRVVAYLQSCGWIHVERRALNGAKDRGDIAGIPGVVIEAKSANRLEFAAWVDEAEQERANDHAALGVCWVKRRGKADASAGYVVMTGETFVDLLNSAGYGGRS